MGRTWCCSPHRRQAVSDALCTYHSRPTSFNSCQRADRPAFKESGRAQQLRDRAGAAPAVLTMLCEWHARGHSSHHESPKHHGVGCRNMARLHAVYLTTLWHTRSPELRQEQRSRIDHKLHEHVRLLQVSLDRMAAIRWQHYHGFITAASGTSCFLDSPSGGRCAGHCPQEEGARAGALERA